MLTPLLISVASMMAAPATNQQIDAKETAIPFVRSNGIGDWKADGDRGLFIRGSDGQWYYGRTQNKCARLKSATTVGFETRGVDQLDRYGAVLVEGWRCQLASVTRADSPERKPN